MTRPFFHRLTLGAWLLALSPSGCARPEGAAEIDWIIVNGNFDDLFPGTRYSSSCALRGLAQWDLSAPVEPSSGTQTAPSLVNVDLELRVRLRVYDCPESASLEQCEQTPLVAEPEFGCQDLRGTVASLPSLERPYLFVVDTAIRVPGQPVIYPDQSCIATAGPRRRRIRAGQITNLAVYQIVINATPDAPLVVNRCRKDDSPATW